MIRAAVIAGFLCVASAATADPALEARERLLAAAGLLEAAESAGDRVAALTDAIRAYEAGLSAMRAERRRLVLKERALSEQLADEDGDLSNLLALMQNATSQAETQGLLHPGSAVDTIRAGTLASALVPGLYERASALESQLTELNDIALIIEAAEASIAEGLLEMQKARDALGEALSNRTDLPPRVATNDAAMEALVNSADTLSGLVDSLAGPPGDAGGPASVEWQAPLSGRLLSEFGSDAARPGWVLASEERALVTSPANVTVRYSGEFPGEGTVVILEGDARRMMLLSGLSTSFVELGQVLAAGEPVGFAGQGQMAAQDNLNARGAESSLFDDETLYIEIRQGGVPVDPGSIITLEQEQG